MYSEKLLYNSISTLLSSGQITKEPEFHSIAYSRHVTSHLATLWNQETLTTTRPLYQDEQDFISNEILLSRLHYPYWAERYTVIYDFSREIIPFTHNLAQKFLLSIISRMEEQGDPIMLQILKLRQLGLSSVIQRIMGHKALFYSNADILVASYDEDQTFKLVNDHIGLVYKNLPWWQLKSWGLSGRAKNCDLGIYESGETYAEFLSSTTSKSKISVQHGRMKSDLGRGTNPTSVHLTELPNFDDPSGSVESGLMNAIHENPFLFIALESTADGTGDWWHSFWSTNVDLWPSRKTRFKPIFIPWYLGTDVWPTEGWLTPKRLRALDHYTPSDLALAHARKAHEYVLSTPELRAHLGSNYEIPKHQLMFWEYSRDYALARDKSSGKSDAIKKWLQEIGAADANECFQTRGESIFPYELIESYRAKSKSPQECYMVESKEISSTLTITAKDEHKPNSEPVHISKLSPNSVKFQSTLRPLVFTPTTTSNARVMIWEPPIPGHKYTISYDDSEGIGKDSSAIEVIRHATWNSPAAQVAEWASNGYSAHDAWPVLLSIAEYYSKYLRPEEEPMIAIELAAKGATVQDELQRRGWSNFYKRYTHINGRTTFSGYGWKTSPATRQVLLDTFLKAVKDEWLEINSKWLIDELSTLESNALQRVIRVEAQSGYHDDRCLAIAIALMCSMPDLAPTSLSLQAERLEEIKRNSSLRTNLTPQMAREDTSLIYFGGTSILTPDREELLSRYARMNDMVSDL